MKKKMLKIVLGSSTGIIVLALVILIPVLMVLDFFGANITDNYVENNMDYADRYKEAVNIAMKNKKGYVPLTRILYFFLEDENQSFYQIYVDNLDKETNRLLPISEVCELQKYKNFDGCKDYESGDQIDEEQNKPFSPPIDFSKVTVTSFFMEERIVFGNSDVHGGWDLACGNKTPVKAVCDGKVTKVSFPYKENVTNTSGGGGNQIYLECEVDEDVTYTVIYAHLYPDTAKVKAGDTVKAGDELAGVGTTGYSTGPHLHYQVELNGNKVDGMSLIDFADNTPNFNQYPDLTPDHNYNFNNNYNNQFRP